MERNVSKEQATQAKSGFGMLFFELLLLIFAIGMFVLAKQTQGVSVVAGLLLLLVLGICLGGFFIVDPNRSKVLVTFGTYRGTVRQPGFYWTNPFTRKKTFSLRAHNLNG